MGIDRDFDLACRDLELKMAKKQAEFEQKVKALEQEAATKIRRVSAWVMAGCVLLGAILFAMGWTLDN